MPSAPIYQIINLAIVLLFFGLTFRLYRQSRTTKVLIQNLKVASGQLAALRKFKDCFVNWDMINVTLTAWAKNISDIDKIAKEALNDVSYPQIQDRRKNLEMRFNIGRNSAITVMGCVPGKIPTLHSYLMTLRSSPEKYDVSKEVHAEVSVVSQPAPNS